MKRIFISLIVILNGNMLFASNAAIAAGVIPVAPVAATKIHANVDLYAPIRTLVALKKLVISNGFLPLVQEELLVLLMQAEIEKAHKLGLTDFINKVSPQAHVVGQKYGTQKDADLKLHKDFGKTLDDKAEKKNGELTVQKIIVPNDIASNFYHKKKGSIEALKDWIKTADKKRKLLVINGGIESSTGREKPLLFVVTERVMYDKKPENFGLFHFLLDNSDFDHELVMMILDFLNFHNFPSDISTAIFKTAVEKGINILIYKKMIEEKLEGNAKVEEQDKKRIIQFLAEDLLKQQREAFEIIARTLPDFKKEWEAAQSNAEKKLVIERAVKKILE